MIIRVVADLETRKKKLLADCNDDGDGNENGKKGMKLYYQNNNFTRTCITLFSTFLGLRCTTTT